MVSVALAIFHFGFNLSPFQQFLMVRAVQFVVAAFIFQEIARWFVMKDPLRKYLAKRWAETLILIVLILSFWNREELNELSGLLLPDLHPENLLLSYLFVTQAVVAFSQLVKLLRESQVLSKIHLGPSQLFVIGFAAPIAVGTLLLKLPAATRDPIGWLDALFMATSAVCVTGLSVVDTETFTTTGHVLVAVLFQLGGLGIMTLTMGLSLIFGGRLGVRERMYLGDILSEERLGEVGKLLRKITTVTLSLELVGALCFYYLREGTFSSFQLGAFFQDLYHAISAFCNVGLALRPAEHFLPENAGYPVLAVLTCLVLMGSIGFPVLMNLWAYLFSFPRSPSRRVLLTYTTKIVLLSTGVIIVAGSALMFFAGGHQLEGSLLERVFHSVFVMATSRTSGFGLIDQQSLGLGAAVLLIVFMWIGGGPMSTAGGVKTVTLSVAFFSLASTLKGLGRVEALGREISSATVMRAFAVIVGSITFIASGTILLLIFEPELQGVSLLFEATSAFSTVGLSHGITAELSSPSRAVLIALMFVGRVGLLTFLASLFKTPQIPHYRYLKESFPIN